MSAGGTAPIHEHAGTSTGAIVRWSLAVAVVFAAHAAGAWTLLARTPDLPAPGAPQAPILIDLVPPAASPEIAPAEAAEAPELVEAPTEPPPVEEPVAEPIAEPEPEPIVEPEPVVEPEPEPEPEPVVEPEPTPAEELQVAGIPLPTARPTPPPRRVERAEPRREEPRRREEAAAQPPRRQQQRPQAPAPSAASQGQQQRQASQGATVSRAAQQQWQGQIQARLNRAKRTPPGGGRGTVQVSFTIAAGGGAGGIRLVGSSGSAALDQAAVALVQRASPFPAPPSGQSVTLTVPIRFD